MFDIAWQELIFAAGNLVFFIGLLPSIFSTDKPAFWTSIITAPFLTLFVFAFYSLELYWSAVGVALGAGAWWILAIQKFLLKRKISIPTT